MSKIIVSLVSKQTIPNVTFIEANSDSALIPCHPAWHHAIDILKS